MCRDVHHSIECLESFKTQNSAKEGKKFHTSENENEPSIHENEISMHENEMHENGRKNQARVDFFIFMYENITFMHEHTCKFQFSCIKI